MRILSITAQKPDSTGSGVYMTELIKNWDKLGHKQAAVAGIYKKDSAHLLEGVRFYPVYFHSKELPFAIAGMSDEMPYESTKYRDFNETMTEQFAAAFQKKIQNAVEEFCPEVIICHHLYLLTALVRQWFPNLPVFGISHGSDVRQISQNSLKRDWIFQKIRSLDGIFALQETHREKIEKLYGCRKEKIRLAGVGYNQEIFYKESQSGERPSGLRIVYAGKISRKKGVESLIRAVGKLHAQMENVTLTLAGGAGDKEEYEKIVSLAKEQNYSLVFTGPLSQQKLAGLFRESKVFVLPSFFEGLPLVNLEAMACGCKIVSTDLDGVKQWYDRNVPDHKITFVKLPRMNNTDEPYPEDLEQFEQRLAKAIEEKLTEKERDVVDTGKVSWLETARRILLEIEKINKQGDLS